MPDQLREHLPTEARPDDGFLAKQRAAELDAIIDSLRDAVYVGNEDGIDRCNKAALENLGCESIAELQEQIAALNEKLQNRYADTGERIRPEDEAFARALRGESRTYEVISRNLRSGEEIIQRCAANPIRYDGRVIGAVAINTDITAQKRNEQALREALQTLSEREAALVKMTSQLEQANRELEQRATEAAAETAAREAGLRTHSDELHALTRQLVQVQEDERRAIARDLHDTIGQAMTYLGLGLGLLSREPDCPDSARDRIGELRRLVHGTAEELHRLSANLRPPVLDQYGLVPALEQFIASTGQQAGLQLALTVEGMEERLPAETEIMLFRIVQEACTNIIRHAAVNSAAISLRREGEKVQLTVRDNGLGFDVAKAAFSRRLGLVGMRERVETLGGSFAIESSPGQGTEIRVEAPVARPRAGSAVLAASDIAASDAPDSAPAKASDAVPAAELARAKTLSDALVDLMAGMTRQESSEELLKFVLARSREAIGCESANILLPDGDGWVIGYGCQMPESMIGHRLSAADAPVDTAVRRLLQVIVENDLPASRPGVPLGGPWSVMSVAAVPLLVGRDLLGVVNYMYHSRPVPFRPSEIEFLQRLSALVSLALENVRLRDAEAEQRARLAHRVEELQAVFDVLPAGVAIANDTLCKDIRSNRAFCEMLGVPYGVNTSLSADELERPSSFKVISGGSDVAAEELPMQVAAARGEEVHNVILDILRDDGQTRHLLAHAVPLFDGQGAPRGAIGAFIDVTEQRRAEAIYRAIAANYPSGAVVVYDHDLRFLAAGGEALDALGLSPDEMIGRTMAEVYDPDTVARIAPRYRAALAGQPMQQDLEYGGRFFAVEYRPISDGNGRILAAMGASRDITERARMEAELRKANQELALQTAALAGSEAQVREAAATLEARVRVRTAELEALSRRLVELQESERAYVADQLFNQAGQVLAALRFQLDAARKDPSGRRFAARSAETIETLEQAMLELHDLANQLRPVGLDRSTLAGLLRQALRQFGQEHNLVVSFEAGAVEDVRLPVSVVTAVYRAIQEALADIAQRTEVTRVDLVLARVAGHVSIQLRHDGGGPEETWSGSKLAISYVSMRQRIAAIGGNMLAGRAQRGGSWLRIQVPLGRPEQAQ